MGYIAPVAVPEKGASYHQAHRRSWRHQHGPDCLHRKDAQARRDRVRDGAHPGSGRQGPKPGHRRPTPRPRSRLYVRKRRQRPVRQRATGVHADRRYRDRRRNLITQPHGRRPHYRRRPRREHHRRCHGSQLAFRPRYPQPPRCPHSQCRRSPCPA